MSLEAVVRLKDRTTRDKRADVRLGLKGFAAIKGGSQMGGSVKRL